MDGCSTFHFAPQSSYWSRLFTRLRNGTLLLGLVFLAAFLSPIAHADSTSTFKPILAPVSRVDWEIAQQNRVHSTIQITFPTILFDKHLNVFSALMTELPVEFGNLKLNTIGRGLHSTLSYLDGLSLDEARDVIRFLKNIDRATLEKYDLLREVQVLNPEKVELVVVGHHSKFLALKPHPEYVAWQLRYYQMLKDLAPAIYERHRSHKNMGDLAVSEEGVHISLVQWGGEKFPNLSAEQEKELTARMKRLIESKIEDFKKRTKKLPEVKFSLQANPIQLVTAPVSFMTPPTPIVTLRANEKGIPRVSRVGRWVINDPLAEDEFGELVGMHGVEFNVDEFVAGEKSPVVFKPVSNSWVGRPNDGESLTTEEVFGALSPQMQRASKITFNTLSPTKYPRPVLASNSADLKNRFYTTRATHPNLAPEKGIAPLEKVRQLGLRSTESTSIGLALYASSVRKEIQNPGDLDMLVSSLIHVPNSLKSFEEAESFAVKQFVRDTLGQLIQLARKGVISFTELRLGSDATMGLPYEDFVTALEANPYLSEEHILSGFFKDKKGKTWTLEELVKLGDFMKGKIDFFTSDGRIDVSLQFLAGFEWNGAIYSLQRSGIKGVPPLMRTAVYDGLESYMVAASLARPFDHYNAQKGPLIARAIRDIVKAAFSFEMSRGSFSLASNEPLWNPKFMKKFYNFLILLKNGGLGLDEVFVAETKHILQRQGKWQADYDLKSFAERLVVAINRPHLRILNLLKRNINDFNEYNERRQKFREDQWAYRLKETVELVDSLSELISTNDIIVSEDFKVKFRRFKAHFNTASKYQDYSKAVLYMHDARVGNIFNDIETALTRLEGQIIAAKDLTVADKDFVKTLSAYAPHFYYRYIEDRGQDSDGKMQWNLKLMGIEPTESNVRLMREMSLNLDRLSVNDISKRQSILFDKKKSHCAELLTEPDARPNEK